VGWWWVVGWWVVVGGGEILVTRVRALLLCQSLGEFGGKFLNGSVVPETVMMAMRGD
jgi:hypothetical protein